MKKSFLIIFLVIFVFPNLLSAKATLKEGRYLDNQNHFSVKIPSNWQVDEIPKGVSFSATSPEDPKEKTRAVFNVVVQVIPMDIGELSESDKDEIVQKALSQVSQGFQVLDKGSSTIDGQKARWVMGKLQKAPKIARTTQYAFFKDSRIYILTFIATDERYSAHAAEFDKIAKSFKFE